MKKALRLLAATSVGATALLAPIALTASPAQAAGYTYIVETPAPEMGAGCKRYTKVGVDSTKPQPVILVAWVECK